MMKLEQFIIIGLFMCVNFCRCDSDQDEIPSLSIPEDLTDDMGNLEWQDCEKPASCLKYRKSPCTSGKSTVESCGGRVWKEELVGCHACAGGWLKQSGWSGCTGTGCDDTVQHERYSCSNTALQPNCRLIRTRFCGLNTVCNGTWSEWKSDSPPCSDQCGKERRRVLFRECFRDGQSSGSCGSMIENSVTTGLIDTSFDDCSKEACSTTEKTTTITISTTTTQPPQLTWTAWGKWSKCSATCDKKNGQMTRRRECIYTNGLDAGETECPKTETSKETKTCVYSGPPCVKPTTTTAKGRGQKNSTITPTTNLAISPSLKNLAKKVPKETVTSSLFPTNKEKYIGQSESTTQSREDVKPNDDTRQYQMLVIIIATAACLVILVIVIFLCCRKKSTQRVKKHEISVVALQAHSGFTDGGEFERLRKSTVAQNNFNLPSDQNQNNIASFNMMQKLDEPSRQLPEIPQGAKTSNKTSDHIYEDMIIRENRTEERMPNHLESFSYQPSSTSRQRPFSFHDRQRASTIVMRESRRPLTNKMRTRSLHGNTSAITPRKQPPPKPPRKSMIQTSEEIREFRQTPLALYESGKRINNASSPELFNIINSIPPPAYSPPETPMDDQISELTKRSTQQFLTLPEVNLRKGISKSTPSSPNFRHSISSDIPGLLPSVPLNQSNYLSSPMLVSQQGLQFMMPAPASNGGVIFLPVQPIYSTVVRQASPTPLHANTLGSPTISYEPQMGPPQISISAPGNGGSGLSTPSYADMRSPFGSFSDYGEEERFLPHSRSLKELHGTHNRTPAKETLRTDESFVHVNDGINICQGEDNKTQEDCHGYLMPKYPPQNT